MGTGMIAMMAAAQLGISTRSLARYAERGRIPFQKSPGGWRIYSPAAVARLKRQMERRPRR